MDNNQINVASVETVELRMRDKLDNHKKEIDTKLEKQKQKTNSKMEQLMEANAKLDAKVDELTQALINHQNSTAQNFAIVHQRINIVEGFALFSLEQIAAMQKKMEEAGKEAAKNMKLDDLLKIEFPGEKEYIKALCFPTEKEYLQAMSEGKISEFEATYQKASSGSMQGMFETAISGTLNALFATKVDMAKISPADREKLGTAFYGSLIPEIFDSKASNTILAVTTTLLKLSAIGIKYALAVKKKRKVEKEIMSSWAEDMPAIIERMRGCLKEGVIFEEMVEKYCHSYHYNYGRSDVTLKKKDGDSDIKLDGGVRTFEKIPNFIQEIPTFSYDGVRVDLAIKANCTGIFSFEEFLQSDLNKEQKRKFRQDFITYIAFKGIGDFDDYKTCGDTEWKVELAASVGGILVFGLGPLYGLFLGGLRLHWARSWWANADKLKEDLRNCIHNHSSKVLDKILEKLENLSRIKFYADASGSEVAKEFYEEMLKSLYLHVKEGKLESFKEILDLYHRITNTGFANPKNLLEYAYINELAPPHKALGSEMIISAINGIRESVKTIQQTTTPSHESVVTTTNAKGDIVRTGTKLTIPNQFLGAIDNMLVFAAQGAY